ncbi:MAG TPA: DUF255 domain-containing protein [Vicinamibacterales bacterium]|jgi:hypothetical protein
MVEWEEWGAAAFARARREGRPVLLSITAAWCRACHEMDASTYADPAVAALVRDRFVAVRVDADRRPDVNERYHLGGWPTTAFLTADGQIITGATYVTADRMPAVLARVAEAFAQLPDAPGASGPPGGRGDEPAAAAADPDALVESIFASFDPVHGGFGVEPKFPHAAPLALALALHTESGEARWRSIVETTLDAMWDGGLWDADAGGFYRYAPTRDWQQPHQEKLLDTNAALLAIYTEAAVVFGRPVDRERVDAIAGFIGVALRDPAGGYFGSDAEPMLYADGNGLAVSALLKASTVLDSADLTQEALTSFERVLLACYRPGGGVAHQPDGRVRGLLADQVAAMTALLDAHDLTGSEPYQMMAEEIGHYMVQGLADPADGGFFDRLRRDDDIGLLREARKPFAGNADAAMALWRLQRISREFDFRTAATGALLAAGRQAARQGPLAAHYVLAARRLR